MSLLGKYKSLLENAFCTLIRQILRYHPSKLELEALAGTIAAVTPTSGLNIYIPRSVKRNGKICGRHDKRSKIIRGADHILLSNSLHYTTQQMTSRQSENAWILSTLPPWHMLKLKHETSHHWTGTIRTVNQQDRWVK